MRFHRVKNVSKGEQKVRMLAHRAFVLAGQATPPLAACQSVLDEFARVAEEYGEGLVRVWLETEADVWRLMKGSSPYSGAPVEAAPQETA